MRQWYCIVSKPAQEHRAAYELRNQAFEVYLPLIHSKPLFPRYLFCRFDVLTDNWGKIRSTRGCIDLLKHGFNPQRIRDQIIDAIMAFEATPEAQITPPEFTPNQRITVINGPFSSFEGLFQKSAQGRVKVLLSRFLE